MALIYILAQSPWGPVQLRTAADSGEVLRTCGMRGTAPAEMIDVGERDPAEVVRVATQTMQPAGAGWFAESVAKAANLVAGAVLKVPAATVVADTAQIAVLSHSAAIAGHVESAGGADYNIATANDDIRPRVRRRPGAEGDARAIRAGLGMSQPVFSKAFGLKVSVVRDWEQGRTVPEGAARVLLAAIEASPDTVREAVAADAETPAA